MNSNTTLVPVTHSTPAAGYSPLAPSLHVGEQRQPSFNTAPDAGAGTNNGLGLRDEPTAARTFADLSLRSPIELMTMEFSQEDIYVGDGLIAKGQSSAIIGPAGVGKSLFITQLGMSIVLGSPFLGLPVNCSDKKCLYLQAENSNHRLNRQLNSQFASLSEAERKRVDAHMTFHTIEHEQDFDLRLSGRKADAIARCFNKVQPDVVFVDPLNAYAKGSLNTDEGMLETLKDLVRLAKEANPDAAVVFVHHTRTDGKSVLEAVGPSRGNYGRGSKALHGFSRGTINIAGGHPDDTSKILVACGKNSNGPDFATFGAQRNPETLLFQPDPSFSLETWKLLMSGKSGGRNLATPERVAEFVTDRSLTRQELVAAIKDEFGCGNTKAYDAIAVAEARTILQGADRRFRAVKV